MKKNFIAGIGNKGSEFEDTRHNVGRLALSYFASRNNFPDFELDKKTKALISIGEIKDKETILIMPDSFMNNSGVPISKYIKEKDDINSLIVIYDDIDLPIGKIRISFDRGHGGHNGVLSIIENLKGGNFVRIRIGVSPVDLTLNIQKPSGEKEVTDFVLGKWSKSEREIIDSVLDKVNNAINTILSDGYEKAMNVYN